MSRTDSKPQNVADAPNIKTARNLARNGWAIFPADPATKRPMPGVKWRDQATSDPDQIEAWWRKWPDAMPALPTGKANDVSVVDLDLHGDKDGVAAYRARGLDPDDACLIVRTAGGGLHLYFDHRDGVRNSTAKSGIDVRGEGGYVIAPGAVGKAGTYAVQKGDPAFARLLGLDPFPAALTRPESESDADQPEPGEHDLDTLRDALSYVPNDGSHDDWCEILMALHHATGGGSDGLALALGWSAGYPGFSIREVRDKWKSFGRKDGLLITADTLFAKAREQGWGPDLEWDDELEDSEPSIAELLDDDTGPSIADLLDDTPPAPLEYEGLTFLTPAECAATDPRPYVIKGLLAERDVACIVGAPGVGKSLLAPRLAYAVAQGESVFDRRVRKGGVFYVAAEDEHGMRGRLRALRDDLGEAPNLHLVGGISDLLTTGPVKVKGKTRQRCKQADTLAKAVRDHKPALVVIDTLAMSFPGLEENSAEGMGRVMALARRLTEWGAAVILIHHDTKDGQQGLPRGHSLLNGALDVSIHLRKGDKGVVTGKLTKNRNGSSADLDMAFRIRAAEIGTDSDGDPITAAVCVPCAPLCDDVQRLKPTEQAALESIVRMMGEESEVDASDWRVAAQEDARITTAEKPDSRRRVVAEALRGLARKGEISIVGGVIRLPATGEDFDDDTGEGVDDVE